MFLRNHWYVAAMNHEVGAQAVRPHHPERAGRAVPHRGRHADRAGGSLPAPPPAAVDGQADRRRRAAMPLSRPALRPHRPVRARAGPGHDPGDRHGENLSGGRALQVAVDLDGRSGARRSRQDRRLPLARRSQLGRQARLSPRAVQLAARQRQPARSHPSCLRARDHHRQHGAGRACRGAGAAHAGRRAGDALDHRPAGAAGLRQGRQLHRQRRPLADHRLHAAVFHPARRRRDADRHRRAGGPARRRHPDAQPQRHDAGDRDHDALLLGPGARLRAAQPGHDRAGVRSRSRSRSWRTSRCSPRSSRTSTSIRTRRRPTSTPIPAASRPAASSTGSIKEEQAMAATATAAE